MAHQLTLYCYTTIVVQCLYFIKHFLKTQIYKIIIFCYWQTYFQKPNFRFLEINAN